MKPAILLLSILIPALSIAGNTPASDKSNSGNSKVMTIDAQDTVFFDLTQAIINGTSVEFPVYIKSDDAINSLDFSFKYDHSSCDYDTIINLTSYLELLSNYNSNDSTVYFTSYSFTQTYANNTALVNIRFQSPGGQFDASFLSNVTAYLNGDICTAVIVDLSTGLNENTEEWEILTYPNPASNVIMVNSREPVNTELFTQNGALISASSSPSVTHTQNTSNLAEGVYYLRIFDDTRSVTKKILLNK